MIFLYLALKPLSFTIECLFEDFEGSASGSALSSNFLGESVFSDPSTNDRAPSAFINSNEGAVTPGDWANSGDFLTTSPDMDDSGASLSLSSSSIFDDADGSSELFVGPSAGDSDFMSSDILQSSDVLNPTTASSGLNLIAQGAGGPGITMEQGATQLAKPDTLAFPELEETLEELRKINAQESQDSSGLCPALLPPLPQCPPQQISILLPGGASSTEAFETR